MQPFVQCHLVRLTTPDLLNQARLETYFLAKSDRDAVEDSLRHAQVVAEGLKLCITRLEVFDCHLGGMVDGMWTGGIDRILYDSDNPEDSSIGEKPVFIG
jgi:hypothetical protein